MIKKLTGKLLFIIGIIVFAVFASLYLLVIIFISPRKIPWYTRITCQIFLLGSGHILKVRGTVPEEKDGPYLYMFNHESIFDMFMLGASVKHYITAVGAERQFSYFLWGSLVKRYGAIPIRRKDLTKAIHSLSLAEEAIKEGTSFIISPEGTRTLTGKMNPFKKGPFHLAKNTGVTIIPVGIIGAYEAKSKYEWGINPGILTIHFGDPIKNEIYQDLSVEELRDLIYQKIEKLSSHQYK